MCNRGTDGTDKHIQHAISSCFMQLPSLLIRLVVRLAKCWDRRFWRSLRLSSRAEAFVSKQLSVWICFVILVLFTCWMLLLRWCTGDLYVYDCSWLPIISCNAQGCCWMAAPPGLVSPHYFVADLVWGCLKVHFWWFLYLAAEFLVRFSAADLAARLRLFIFCGLK